MGDGGTATKRGIVMRSHRDATRTTVNLDDDVLEAVRAMARVEGRSLGTVISRLLRRGLAPPTAGIDEGDGFPVFRVPEASPPIADEMVRAALEEG